MKIKLKGKKIWAKLIGFFSFDTVKSANSEMAKKVFFICFILHCYIFSECCKHFLSEYVIGRTLNCFYSGETYTTFLPYPGCPKIDQTALTWKIIKGIGLKICIPIPFKSCYTCMKFSNDRLSINEKVERNRNYHAVCIIRR